MTAIPRTKLASLPSLRLLTPSATPSSANTRQATGIENFLWISITGIVERLVPALQLGDRAPAARGWSSRVSRAPGRGGERRFPDRARRPADRTGRSRRWPGRPGFVVCRAPSSSTISMVLLVAIDDHPAAPRRIDDRPLARSWCRPRARPASRRWPGFRGRRGRCWGSRRRTRARGPVPRRGRRRCAA